jgi:hypothetical protein
LPWANIKSDNKDELYNKILQMKNQTPPEKLCMGLPPQFEEFIRYIRGMSYEQEPDYKYLRNLFLITLKNNGGSLDFSYDWDNKINDVNLFIQNINSGNNNPARENLTKNNFEPNNEKVFNDDNTLKNNYNNQVQIALQNNIFKQNEINESGIEPFPLDTNDYNDLNVMQNGNKSLINGAPIPNRKLKTGNCECCSIM